MLTRNILKQQNEIGDVDMLKNVAKARWVHVRMNLIGAGLCLRLHAGVRACCSCQLVVASHDDARDAPIVQLDDCSLLSSCAPRGSYNTIVA